MVVSEHSIIFHNIPESSDDGSLSPGCMPVRRYKYAYKLSLSVQMRRRYTTVK